MSECTVCFEYMGDKVTLECTHEVCLGCIVKIIKIKKLSCPMCRKKYDIEIRQLYKKEDKEEDGGGGQQFGAPHEHAINLSPQSGHDLRNLIIIGHLGGQCNFYGVFVIYGGALHQPSFIILHNTTTEIIERLIYNSIILAIPGGLTLQHLKQGVAKFGQCGMGGTNHYPQDYFDVLIQRITN